MSEFLINLMVSSFIIVPEVFQFISRHPVGAGEYLRRETLVQAAFQALTLTNTVSKYNVVARVSGGGLTGQSGAVRLAVARALVREDESLRGVLGHAGMLTRDPRMKERKKYGQPGARKRFQFSKR